MKTFTRLFLLFFIAITATSGLAQEQLQHQKKMYVDENGRFYMNRHLPVYFFVSNDASGKDMHKLKSETSPQYSNPAYFDMDGYNTWRTPSQVDTVTKKVVLPKQDIKFEVYADGKAPFTTSKFIEAPRYYNPNGTIYYGVGLKVDLSAKDNVSGVEQIFYSINGAAFQKYTSPVAISTEGNFNFKYYSVDNVGNAEQTRSKEFIVDLTTPVTVQKVNGEITNDIISPKALIILTSDDNSSGVKNVYYYFDSNKPRLYTRPISLAYLKDGDHKLTFYAIDNVKNDEGAGNKDPKNEYKFYLDNSVPFASAEVEGDQYSGNQLYISERSKIKLTSTDNKGGVNKIEYGINKSATDLYASPFAMPTRKGIHVVNFKATDNVMNKTPNHQYRVFMDNVKPATRMFISTPKFFNRDTLFIMKSTNISLTSTDYGSGVAKIEYAVDGDTYVEYSKFNIEKDGYHMIKYRSIDKVNNMEDVKIQEVVVDNSAPEIYSFFSVNPIGEESKEGKKYSVYPTYARIFLAATDQYCGTEKLHYSINGGPLNSYLGAQNLAESNMLAKEGFYTIKIVAKDKLGNTNEKVLEFFTRKTIKDVIVE